MHIRATAERNVAILHLQGDFLTEPDQLRLKESIRGLIQSGTKHVILDLARVKYMNSCGLGSLVGALTTMRMAGGDLRLVRAQASVRKLFAVTQLESVFDSYRTIKRAVAQSRSGEA